MHFTTVCGVVISLLCVLTVYSYHHFPDRIPNGRNIFHPCKPNTMWYAIGHNNSLGGGIRNVFGEDFARYDFEWNKCLCEEDSDGDGLTNGQELGDPYCEWKPNTQPLYTTGLSHPGVCDSIYRDCSQQNTWVDCEVQHAEPCAGVSDPEVEVVTIRYPETRVPKNETTYMCYGFNLTEYIPEHLQNKELHLFASQGLIDNPNVMHHTTLYACPDASGVAVLERYKEPVSCGMDYYIQCPDAIAVWTIGGNWYCSNPNAGTPVGINGYKYVLMQHHWNNPEERGDYLDSSGLDLYVTEKKRPYDSGVWFVGPAFLQLPPGWPSLTIHGGCSVSCNERMLTETIYITHILPHMHYLGMSFRFAIYHDGQQVFEFNKDRYFAETPEVKTYDPPLEVLPGDEVRVDCTYQTKTRDDFTYHGEGTYDEMCFAIMTYYPFVSTLTPCMTNLGGYGFCTNRMAVNVNATGECTWAEFNSVIGQYSESIMDSCDKTGIQCKVGCQELIDEVNNHHCFSGYLGEQMKFILLLNGEKQFLNALASCDDKAPPMIGDDRSISHGYEKCDRPITDAAVFLHVDFMLTLIGLFLIIVFVL